ncbi:MAG: hypothetical protein H6895_02465 [Defluviimonas sp.]|uniref:L,D-transpeptidase family protein n=1 Tax=Albidovulum sp. TaxID=1872424 RepID=UPI002A28C546|nr:hypothetical protein [Defluviimonas sp.]
MDLVVAASGTGYRARFGARDWRCAVGRGGIARKTGEGDGISPLGCWSLRRLLYRPDRFEDLPVTALPRAPLDPQDGWCDAPDHGDYNRPVRLPFAGRHEVLWRDDALYDLIVVLGHNDDPVVPGAGSAIFLHVADPGYGPTEGCAALSRPDLLEFLSLADRSTRLCFAG